MVGLGGVEVHPMEGGRVAYLGLESPPEGTSTDHLRNTNYLLVQSQNLLALYNF